MKKHAVKKGAIEPNDPGIEKAGVKRPNFGHAIRGKKKSSRGRKRG